MSSKKETLTLSLFPDTKNKLEEIARDNDLFWGRRPSPSALISAIANREIVVGVPFYLSKERVSSSLQAIRIMVNDGYIKEAESVARLILDKGKIDEVRGSPVLSARGLSDFSTRQELLSIINKHLNKWRILIEEYITRKQSFEILYNEDGKEVIYDVRFAQVDFYQSRFWLNIWSENVKNNEQVNEKYFPELIHNRCLDFDHIEGVIPQSEGFHWRDKFDYLEVELEFSNSLVEGYQTNSNDVNDVINGKFRKITKKVTNPSLLINELLKYGLDCKIVAPKELQNFYLQELVKLSEKHG